MKIDLPEFTYHYKRRTKKGLRHDFYFTVKPAYRPKGWTPTIRLPIDPELRTRDASRDEVLAVIQDANALLARMRGEPIVEESRFARGALPWLHEIWLEETAELKPKTREFYQLGWSRIARWSAKHGDKSVAGLKWPAIHKFLKRMDETPSTQRAARSVLMQLLQIAKNEGVIEISPFVGEEKTRTRRKRGQQSEIKTLDYEQLTRLVAICDGARRPSIGTALLIGFDLMQYPSHTVSFMRGKDYDPASGMFDFGRNKTGEPVLTSVSPTLRERLAKSELFLVVNEETGQPYTKRALGDALKRIIAAIPDKEERAAFEGFRLGWLRHSGVIESERAGLTDKEIADIGGWKSAATVRGIIDRHYGVRDPKIANRGQKKRQDYREE